VVADFYSCLFKSGIYICEESFSFCSLQKCYRGEVYSRNASLDIEILEFSPGVIRAKYHLEHKEEPRIFSLQHFKGQQPRSRHYPVYNREGQETRKKKMQTENIPESEEVNLIVFNTNSNNSWIVNEPNKIKNNAKNLLEVRVVGRDGILELTYHPRYFYYILLFYLSGIVVFIVVLGRTNNIKISR
jgi:hypothetical protein